MSARKGIADMFSGKLCRQCGFTVRYRSSKRCVFCSRDRNMANWLKVQKMLKQLFVETAA